MNPKPTINQFRTTTGQELGKVQAYPSQFTIKNQNGDGVDQVYIHVGMTIRQHYVGQALAGLCANPDFMQKVAALSADEKQADERLGAFAVQLADAALEQEAK
jgi:hypothetical protein